MKPLKLVLFLSLAIVLGSCSSDDDNSNPDRLTEENFFGKYDLKSLATKEVKTVEDEDGFDPTVTTTTKEGSVFQMSYDFQETGTLVIDGIYTISGKREKNGETVPIEADYVRKDKEEAGYSLNAGEKKIEFNGKEYDIKGFSNSGFTLSYSNEAEKNDGKEIIETTEEMKFERKE